MKTILPSALHENANTASSATKTVLSLAILLVGTLLVGFSMGRWLAPLAAWIGPILIMRFARDHTVGRGFLFIIPAYILAFLIAFAEIWVGGFSPPLMPILAVSYGFLWSLPYLADRLVSPRLHNFLGTFVYPLAATTLEFVNTQVNPVGDWGVTGFTQYGDLPLMQIASVTGIIGITFLMGWFASVANWAWENRSRRSEVLKGLAVFGVILATVYLFGFVRLNLASTSDTVRVAGITAQSWHGSSLEELVQEIPSVRTAYFDKTLREAQAGAKVIVWAEISGAGLGSDEASFIARAQQVARQNGIYLAIPFYTIYPDTGRKNENKLLLFDPTGTIVIEHVKYGGNIFEGTLLGDKKLKTVTTPFGVLSGVICYDLDYSAVIQQTGQNGTGLILAPSKDWRAIDPAHSHMAVFRAIENGMSIVRQTDTGLSIAVDAYGRVLAQVSFYSSTDRTMVAQVPVTHVATLYTAFGRWSGWLCLIGFLMVVARALIVRQVEA